MESVIQCGFSSIGELLLFSLIASVGEESDPGDPWGIYWLAAALMAGAVAWAFGVE